MRALSLSHYINDNLPLNTLALVGSIPFSLLLRILFLSSLILTQISDTTFLCFYDSLRIITSYFNSYNSSYLFGSYTLQIFFVRRVYVSSSGRPPPWPFTVSAVLGTRPGGQDVFFLLFFLFASYC